MINFQNPPRLYKKIVTSYSETIRQLVIKEISEHKLNGKGFSITFDEWTSLRNQQYINVNLHSESKFWNLGLLQINGCLAAEKLNQYGLSLEKNIVCLTKDGAAVMQKVGKLIPAAQQLCLAHAIQLAVVDVLYKKETTKKRTFCSNESIDFDSYSDAEKHKNYGAFENISNTYEEGLGYTRTRYRNNT